MNAIIVDDEKKGRELLQVLISTYCKNVTIIGMANSAAKAITLINEKQPDLLFLDIEMPGGSGFDLLEQLGNSNISVIFVTAYDQYAIKAIKFSAIDYLLKPVNEKELIKAVEKVEQAQQIKLLQVEKPDVESLVANYKNLKGLNDKLAITSLSGLVFVEISKITHCKADGKYTWIYLEDAKEILATKNLGEFEGFLSTYNFVRVHNSHLVNLSFIKSFQNRRTGVITMYDGTEIDVSQRKKDEFLKRLNKI